MPFQGSTQVVVSVDSYDRGAGTVGALTVLPAKDIESISFQLPTEKTVRGDGLAEVYEYMVKTGKKVLPDAQIVLKTDLTNGAPTANSAYAILGRPEEAGHPTRTLRIAVASGMSLTWEMSQNAVTPAQPRDNLLMTTHNIQHASNVAPIFAGF